MNRWSGFDLVAIPVERAAADAPEQS
jgi:hypothetical protein